MGFSYSNSCDLFGPNFCEVMRNVRSGSNDNNKEKNYDDLDRMIEKLNERISKLF